MRLVAQTGFGVRLGLLQGDSSARILSPERNLQHMVRLLQQRIGNAQALKNLNRATLDPVCLADLKRALTTLEQFEVDAKASQPDGRAEAG
jgi:hypothetical protein